MVSVLINHSNSLLASQWIPGHGRLLVLSGYVVAGSWGVNPKAQTSSQAFDALRIGRLLSALYICVVATLQIDDC